MRHHALMMIAALSLTAPALAENAASATVQPGTEAVKTADLPAALKAEVKIGTDVQNREPAGVADSFGAEVPSVAAWCRITGATHPTEITQVWIRNGEEVSRVKLKVQSASYRTYSRKSVAGLPGNWSVQVVDAEGKTIGSADFNVLPQGSNATASPAVPLPGTK